MFILQIKSIDPVMDQLANVPVESYKWGFRVLVALEIGLHQTNRNNTTNRLSCNQRVWLHHQGVVVLGIPDFVRPELPDNGAKSTRACFFKDAPGAPESASMEVSQTLKNDVTRP